VRDFQIVGGPAWISSERYDILAKPEEAVQVSAVDRNQMRVRIQALLADRFQLTLHRETREMPVYALVVAKNGRKLKEHTVADQETGLRRGQDQITGNQVAIPFLALTLFPSTGPLC
jgi:uncharacterized protein (TIGR03435 family)